MEEVKRWKVTFTKHLKQKRKVYQDGLLDIHRSTNKALLYDECEKLLECRILKQDEVISPGETLIFNSYLVDIDIAEADDKPKSGLTFQASGDKISEKPRLQQGKHLRNYSFLFTKNKASAQKNKTWPTLSPSHKIIRDFKKSKLKCYGSPQSSPDTRKTIETEWQVLYTTQMTQKSKKYHDGFLKLSACGSLVRQALLYDENKKLLDSRFIKKDEIVKSGESIAFDAHLVEIGEREINQSTNIDGGTRALHEQKNYFNGNDKSTRKEWHVLYTSQTTQKSKKYHNGIMKLSSSGSQHVQVTLLSEDKIVLSSKYVSLSEDYVTGHVLELPKYLVEVGEACESAQGKYGNYNHKSRKETSSCISVDDEKELGREITKKPLRDACEILSFLQKPKARLSIPEVHTDESIRISAMSSNLLELSNTKVLDILEEDDLSREKSNENQDTGESTENAESSELHVLIQSNITGSCRPLAEDIEIKHSSQITMQNKSTSLMPKSSDCAVFDEQKGCEESTYEEECPTFELGI